VGTPSGRSVRFTRAAATAIAVALFSSAPVFADTFTWNNSTTGTNSWNLASNWINNSRPVSSNTADILFAQTAASRTSPVQDIANPLTLRSLWFYDNPYTLTGNGLTFDGALAAIYNYTTTSISNSITLNSTTSYEGSGNLTITNNSTIVGAGGFIKNGSGTVTINTFTLYAGATDVNAGQISFGHTQALLSTTVNLNVDNGLALNGYTAVIGNIAGSGSLNLGTANISVGGNNSSQTYSGPISATTGSIDKRGSGTWTLSGANSTFPKFLVTGGRTVLSGGSLTLTSTGGINRALNVGVIGVGHLSVEAGAVLNTLAGGAGYAQIKGTSSVASTLTVTGPGSRWDGWRIDIGGSATSPGRVVADSGGIINASDIFVGNPDGLLVQNGSLVSVNRLEVNNAAADTFPTVALRSNGQTFAAETILSTPTSSIDIDRSTLTTGMLTSSLGNGSITLRNPAGSGSAMVISGTGASATYSGSIKGSGGITKNGGSTQTLSGQNNYTGPTIVNNGVLVMSNGSSASYTATGPGELQLNFSDFGHSSFRVSGGGTIHYPTNVMGGFLRGSDGTHDIREVASFNGTTFGADTALTPPNPIQLNNVTNSGALTSSGTIRWDGGGNASAGRFTVDGETLVSSFENNGVMTIRRHGFLINSDTNLVSGGGSEITIEGQGQIFLQGGTTLDLRGSLLVNNGTVGGTTNVYFGALAAGVGSFDKVIVHPGGAYTPGVTLANMPAPTPTLMGMIAPLDPDQSAASPVDLRADTIATVSTFDRALSLSGAMSAPDKTLTKQGGGLLALGRLRAGELLIDDGAVQILAAGAGAGANTLNTLRLSSATKLDLTDNKLIVTAGDVGTFDGVQYTGLTGLIASASNGGAWDGSGITSSMPDAAIGLTSLAIATADQAGLEKFGGVGVAGTDVLILYTYAGDANLDGFISGDDYSTIDFNVGTRADGWYNGDFNYDGIISGDDYSTIDFNYAAQGAPFPTSAAAASVTAVPEPILAPVIVLLAPLARRRRRRQRANTGQ
jgi:autotransporter-associated beta strand protein